MSSYIFRVSKFGHLEHIHYGVKIPADADPESLRLKTTAVMGSSVLYDESDGFYCLDTLPLEWSGIGKGDYRNSPVEIGMADHGFVSDFSYRGYRIDKGHLPMTHLPVASGESQTESDGCRHLIIEMSDDPGGAVLELIYTVYPDCDVITRRAVLKNSGTTGRLQIRKLMSMMIDLPDRGFSLTTLHGGWIREGQLQKQPLTYGTIVHASSTGNSSNRHNPAFMLAERDAGENYGQVYGFNLVYSGNHYEAVELSEQGLVRIMTGINPHCFEWILAPGQKFETPEAVMTFSNAGYNKCSQNFHKFINDCIVPDHWRRRKRPILINSWESHYFRFNQQKLLRLAGEAADLGIELFVLDDGWFGRRNDDKSSLGDYDVNKEKFPQGLKVFADKIRKRGLQFGLWVEPEMVNPDSELYRSHPEYTVQVPGRQPSMGRNQLVLDLCRQEVRDYIVESVGRILDLTDADYVKWDMNRHISDMYSAAVSQSAFFHSYIIGLYEVLHRIFGPRPQILLESCSSGGNRFDLGMLCFSPQIWASDNIDPIERLDIQEGLSYFYPLSTIGSHVADSPHSQTLRRTTLATRFHVAAFGCLGYEFNLSFLNRLQKKAVKEQISFYKKYRMVFQFGEFYRLKSERDHQIQWQVVSPGCRTAVAGFFQKQQKAAGGFDRLNLFGLQADLEYTVKTRPLRLYLDQFGSLINHLLPFAVKPDNPALRLAGRFYTLSDCTEAYHASGKQLQAGIMLNNQYTGTGYNQNIRMMGDFGSHLYLAEADKHD
jgi:alpha-galactosidase